MMTRQAGTRDDIVRFFFLSSLCYVLKRLRLDCRDSMAFLIGFAAAMQ